MKQTIRMNEAELNRLISESVMRVLNEGMNEETDEVLGLGFLGNKAKQAATKAVDNISSATRDAVENGRQYADRVKKGVSALGQNMRDYEDEQKKIKANKQQQKYITNIQNQLKNIKQYAIQKLGEQESGVIARQIENAITSCNDTATEYTKRATNISDAENEKQGILSRGMFSNPNVNE